MVAVPYEVILLVATGYGPLEPKLLLTLSV
jgi:hypothetical protein